MLIQLTWKESTKMEIKPRKPCQKNTEKNDILNLICPFLRRLTFLCIFLYKIPIMFVEVSIVASGKAGTFISVYCVLNGV